MQTLVVYSLNNVIIASFHSIHAGPNYQNQGQLCHCSSVRVHPYAYHQHMIVLKHFLWEAVCGGSCHHFIVAILAQSAKIWANLASEKM